MLCNYFGFELKKWILNNLKNFYYGFLGYLYILELFLTVSVVYLDVLYIKVIEILRLECYKTVFVYIEQFCNILQVQVRIQILSNAYLWYIYAV